MSCQQTVLVALCPVHTLHIRNVTMKILISRTVEVSWNAMARAQKPDIVFPRKGRVHLNQRGRQFRRLLAAEVSASAVVEHVWKLMAHARKPDLVFQRNGRVHLNWREGGQFNRLLAAEVCTSAVVMVAMLDTPCSEVECKTTAYPLYSHVSPSLPLPCVTVCHQVSTEL